MGWIILIVVVLILIWIVSVYNGLISSRQKVENAWSQIDVQLQRRFDLIPDGYFNGLSSSFEDLGLKSKIWSVTNDVFNKDKYLIRELSSDSDKIGRSMSNIGDKLLIRLVR